MRCDVKLRALCVRDETTGIWWAWHRHHLAEGVIASGETPDIALRTLQQRLLDIARAVREQIGEHSLDGLVIASYVCDWVQDARIARLFWGAFGTGRLAAPLKERARA